MLNTLSKARYPPVAWKRRSDRLTQLVGLRGTPPFWFSRVCITYVIVRKRADREYGGQPKINKLPVINTLRVFESLFLRAI
jgi:hypothetical protein